MIVPIEASFYKDLFSIVVDTKEDAIILMKMNE